MLKKSLLVFSLLLPLATLSVTAQAGLTISDQRYRPSEVRQSTQARIGDVNSAFANDRAVPRLQPETTINNAAADWRYQGGPKFQATHTGGR